jgi:hypothetical protein
VRRNLSTTDESVPDEEQHGAGPVKHSVERRKLVERKHEDENSAVSFQQSAKLRIFRA